MQTSFIPHPLHSDAQIWKEKNCYVDAWISAIHSLGMDPLPMLAFTVTEDYVPDQWVFFKPWPSDLYSLYGIEVQELNVWRPLADHIESQVRAGNWVACEVDAFWLPDASGTDYRKNHTKTTVIVTRFDLAKMEADYFHNAGFFEVRGEDFQKLFLLSGVSDGHLPPFAELINTSRLVKRDRKDLGQVAMRVFKEHLDRRPTLNPFHRFADALESQFEHLCRSGLDHFHLWAFANVRQCGSAFELASEFATWLTQSEPRATGAALSAREAFSSLARESHVLQMKLARAVHHRRPVEFKVHLERMSQYWVDAISASLRIVEAMDKAAESATAR